MPRLRSGEDLVTTRWIGTGSRKGKTWFGTAGDLIRHPPVWAGIAALLALSGPRGRRAGLRGIVCYEAAALAHLPIKALVGRSHPRGAGLRNLGPITSSFPSGHAASDLAFALGAAQELPMLFIPLSGATLAVHWSLIRKRAHHPSDVFAGGVLGVSVAMVAWMWWPPRSGVDAGDASTAGLPRAGGSRSTRSPSS